MVADMRCLYDCHDARSMSRQASGFSKYAFNNPIISPDNNCIAVVCMHMQERVPWGCRPSRQLRLCGSSCCSRMAAAVLQVAVLARLTTCWLRRACRCDHVRAGTCAWHRHVAQMSFMCAALCLPGPSLCLRVLFVFQSGALQSPLLLCSCRAVLCCALLRHPQEFRQAAQDHDFGVLSSAMNADDRILQCAIAEAAALKQQQQEQRMQPSGWSHHGVLLLTNDKVMSLKVCVGMWTCVHASCVLLSLQCAGTQC